MMKKKKMFVHDGLGGVKTYTGYITLGDRHYRLGPDTVLSRIFFRARDTTGAPVKDPVTGASTWDPKGCVDRFFDSPAAYFQYRNPWPDPGREAEESHYHQDVAAWQAQQQAFVHAHGDWFEQRRELLRDPPASEELKALEPY